MWRTHTTPTPAEPPDPTPDPTNAPTPDPTLTRPATPSRRIAEFDEVIEEAEKKARALREDSLKLEVTRRRPVAAFGN